LSVKEKDITIKFTMHVWSSIFRSYPWCNTKKRNIARKNHIKNVERYRYLKPIDEMQLILRFKNHISILQQKLLLSYTEERDMSSHVLTCNITIPCERCDSPVLRDFSGGSNCTTCNRFLCSECLYVKYRIIKKEDTKCYQCNYSFLAKTACRQCYNSRIKILFNQPLTECQVCLYSFCSRHENYHQLFCTLEE
jgi:hypothetical protein